MRLAEVFLTRLVNLMAVVACLLLVAVMLATILKVALRGLFGIGVIGVDQLSGNALVYLTFLGAAWVLRREGHVTMDIVLAGVTSGIRRRLIVLNSLIGAAICFALAYFGYHAIEVSIARQVVVVTELEIPRAIGLAPIPVGAFLLGLEFLRRAIAARRGTLETDPDHPHGA